MRWLAKIGLALAVFSAVAPGPAQATDWGWSCDQYDKGTIIGCVRCEVLCEVCGKDVSMDVCSRCSKHHCGEPCTYSYTNWWGYCDSSYDPCKEYCDPNIEGAKVELLYKGCVIATTCTGDKGCFYFLYVTPGYYTIRVRAKDFDSFKSETIYVTSGYNCLKCIKLSPLPVNYMGVESFSGGQISFADASRPVFVQSAIGQPTVTEADLYDATKVDHNKSYPYVGFIPNFPELGHFGGLNEPKLYVFIDKELAPNNLFISSFQNQIGVFGRPGGRGYNPVDKYAYRFTFLLPFTGPGTAHCFQAIDVRYTVDGTTFLDGKIVKSLSAVPTNGTYGPKPDAGDVPPGYMGRAIGQFILPPGIFADVFVDGSYKNACCKKYCFTLTPPSAPSR